VVSCSLPSDPFPSPFFDMFGSFLRHLFVHAEQGIPSKQAAFFKPKKVDPNASNGHMVGMDDTAATTTTKSQQGKKDDEDEDDENAFQIAEISNGGHMESNWKKLDLFSLVILIPIFFLLVAISTSSAISNGDNAIFIVQTIYHAIYVVLLVICYFFLWFLAKPSIQEFSISWKLNLDKIIRFGLLVTTGALSLGTDVALMYLYVNYPGDGGVLVAQVIDRAFSFVNVIMQLCLIYILFAGYLKDSYAKLLKVKRLRFMIYFIHWLIHTLFVYNLLWVFLGIVAENSLHNYVGVAPKNLVASLEVMMPLAIEFRTTFAYLAAIYGFRSKRARDEKLDAQLEL